MYIYIYINIYGVYERFNQENMVVFQGYYMEIQAKHGDSAKRNVFFSFK